ncbi:ABC transporter ATP-binding protein [Pseudidiomarina sediminum]|uniref:ABC transporter ATP-binding protein n=1 Tax=Pseudidiomarina sediminum TaxID=431675 RepID=A0A432ZAH8_9GAMM|nr:ABC transporter ATP-binding protein [Pseudidiomarina sediminum]RUO74919.1 ABC transporter ATP-binding protein [Pseudidiomarina sediminum]
MTNLLTLTHVARQFGKEDNRFTALHDIDLEVNDGDTLAIVGPSGSGKSTLLSILGLLDRSYTGTYALKSTDVAALDSKQLAQLRNREIGWVFQNFNLINHLSVLHNVVLPMRYNSTIAKDTYQQRAMAVLEQVGLVDKAQAKPTELSGGQQQRVAIARALVNAPSLVLADEPTGNLDSATGAKITELLMSLAATGTTVILVTHDPVVAAACGKVLQLKDGSIVA